MEVLWLGLLLLALLTITESTLDVESLKITRIQRTRDDSEGLLICSDKFPASANKYILVYDIGMGNETNIEAKEKIDSNCLKFAIEMETFSSKLTEMFLAFRDADNNDTLLGEAEATLQMPELTYLRASWVGERTNDEGTLERDLRTTGATWYPCRVYVGDSPESRSCTCNSRACYSFGVGNEENTEDPVFKCQDLDNTMQGHEDEKVEFCTEKTTATVILKEGPKVREAKLDYKTKTVSIASVNPGETQVDIIVQADDVKICGATVLSPGECGIDPYIPGDKEITILLVVGELEEELASTSVVLKDYNLVGTAVSQTTLEMRWTRDHSYNHYWATLMDNNKQFTETEVTCDENLDHCYAYFTAVDESVQSVLVQPYNGTKLLTNEVVSQEVNMQLGIKALHIGQVQLFWDSEVVTAEVKVCLQQPTNVTLNAAVQLLLLDAAGHWHRGHGLSHQMDGHLCFTRISVDSRQFDLTKKVSIVVTEFDVDDNIVIANGQSDVFVIAPKVESIGGRMFHLSWSNPGEYTFTVKGTNHPTPLATSLTCHSCFYYLSENSQTTQEWLVVETEDLGMRIMAEVPLSSSADPDVTTVTIDKIVWTPPLITDICWPHNQYQENVTHAEVTIIMPSQDQMTTEENVGGQVDAGPCASFTALPEVPKDQRVMLELRLYMQTQESFTQIQRGSIDFTMPDLSTFPVCENAYKVEDKMLRLTCSKPGQDTMIIDGTPVDIAGKSELDFIQYILMKKVIGNELSFQRTVLNVTVNDGPTKHSIDVASAKLPIKNTSDELTLSSVMLEYDPKQTTLETSLDLTKELADVVNYWEEDSGTYIIYPCLELTPDWLQCAASEYIPGLRKLNILVVGYQCEKPDVMIKSTKHKLQDYDLNGRFITRSTIELEWTMSDSDTTYCATIQTVNPESNGQEHPFDMADVKCDMSDKSCYVYFLDLPSTSSYKIMIQPKTGDTPNDQNKVVSDEIEHLMVMQDSAKWIPELLVQEIHLEWNSSDQTVAVTVCFQHSGSILDTAGLTQYQLVLVIETKHWYRTQEVSKKSDNLLCFSAVTVDTSHLNVISKMAVTVSERDIQDHAVLASGHCDMHLISLTVEHLGSSITLGSWNNPGGYTFTIKRQCLPTPLVTSICHTCSYYLSSQEFGVQVEGRKSLETQNLPIKLTAGITLDMVFTDLPWISINYLTFLIIKEPSGAMIPISVGAKSELAVPVSEITLGFILPQDTSSVQYIDSIDVTELPDDNTEYNFSNVTDFALVAGEVAVMIVAHKNKEAVAVGYAEVTLEDISSTAMKVGKVGEGYGAFRFTFSKSPTSGDVQLDYIKSCTCVNSPCYCLGERTNGEPQPLCLNLKFTVPDSGTLLHCNDKLQADVADTDVVVMKVSMTHKAEEDTVNIMVEVSSVETLNKIEVLFYEVSDTSLTSPTTTCNVSRNNICPISNLPISKDVTDFSILLVGVDSSEAVLQSSLLSFEDYKVVVQQLTADAIEIRWVSSEKKLYNITVSPDGGAYDSTTVTCGNEESNKCKAYFISIPDSRPCIATVQKNEDGNKNIVASEFALERLVSESPRNATLTLRMQSNKTYLSVCLEEQTNIAANYTLAVIDQKGAFVDMTGTDPCFPELPLDILIMEQLRVLVHTEFDDIGGLVALDTDFHLLDSSSDHSLLQITQIGNRTLKASWTNRNSITLQYELSVNGKSSIAQCKAKAKCVKYLHLESTQRSQAVSITENNKGTLQVATVDVPIKDIKVMMIVSTAIQLDNRLQVCFLKPQGAVSYELGIEKSSDHVETTTRAQVVTEFNGLTCINSSEKVDVGVLTELWLVITAFKNNGSIMASGESTWRTI